MSEPSEHKANVLNLIEQLQAETEKLRSENQRLKDENNRLKGEQVPIRFNTVHLKQISLAHPLKKGVGGGTRKLLKSPFLRGI